MSSIEPQIEILGTVVFLFAIVHTFFSKLILNQAAKFKKGSLPEAMLHLLGEIEIVFAFWGFIFCSLWLVLRGVAPVILHLESLHFSEPIFVFCIMVASSTRPMIVLAKESILTLSHWLSKLFRVHRVLMDLFIILSFGSLAGSLITEPAAMTVSAVLLYSLLDRAPSRLLYGALAVLFVNISIGGSLSHFAAPPILMVAGTWHWDFSYVFGHFGWKALIAVFVNSGLLVLLEKNSIKTFCRSLAESEKEKAVPLVVILIHLFLLVTMILASHHSVVLVCLFILFLGVVTLTSSYHQSLRLKESLLVSVFLAGIIVFGSFQKWWLQPLLKSLGDLQIYFASVFLTSITDNAALTYLGAQVPGLSDSAKYYLVAGAIAGGGLTVIANAPNAAGFSILQSKFKSGLSPLWLFVAALPPTIIAVLFLEFLPHLTI